MAIKYFRKNKNKKKGWHKKKKVYRKPSMKMYKVPKMKTIGLKREQWFDMNFAIPGGSVWTIGGRVDPLVLATTPVMNMRINPAAAEGDPEFSRITWQPIFTFAQLPDLSDVSGMFRLFKINKISITLYPMRNSNPILDVGAPTIPQTGIGVGQYLRSQVSPNLLITTLYAKSGLDNRIGMGTDSLAQIQNKQTKLFNLGIGNKKIGWYFKPYCQDITYKNPTATTVPVVDDQVDISSAFTKTIKKPGYQDIEQGKYTEHFGPLISFRSIDGSNLAGGTAAANNMEFRVCVKYYFQLKGTH